MRKRMMVVAAGALLVGGGFAAAQVPPFPFQADRVVRDVQWGLGQLGGVRAAPVPVQTTLIGNVVFEVNGALVRADRAVIKDREVSLEGNVRLTLPQPK